MSVNVSSWDALDVENEGKRIQYFFQKADVTCSQSISYTLEYSFTLIALCQVFASVQLCGTQSTIAVDVARNGGNGAMMERSDRVHS